MTAAAWLAAATLLAAPAPAAESTQGHVQFVFKQMNVPVEGAFRRFTAQVRFDPKQPEKSRAEIEIDLRSIDTGVHEADAEAQSPDWFDTARASTATFVSTAVRNPAPDRYDVTGRLTIKGRTKEVTVPVRAQRVGASTAYEGELTLKRLDFAIGEGIWTDTSVVADEVEVRFRLLPAADQPRTPK
jgi:polyisoprenoid-binding protein YceI